MKLSVIVPIYNTGKFLEECLDSLVNQTYKNLEIICVNDGSTDNSLSILENYAQKDNRIKVINQENKGQSAARNAGLEAAQGNLITFIDSDDFIEPKTYETVLKYSDEADIVCFGIKVFGDTGYANRNSDDEYYCIKYSGKQKLNNEILMTTDCSVCNKIFKKEILDKYNIKFPVEIHYEDAEFYFKYMFVINSAYFIDKYFYNYRRRANSIMLQTFDNCPFVIEHLYIIDDLYEYLQQLNIFHENEKLFIDVFKTCFSFAFDRAPDNKKFDVLGLANIYAKKFQFSKKVRSNFIKALKKTKYNDIWEPDLSFLEKIFSIKKVWLPVSEAKRKDINIMGLKIKFRNRVKELEAKCHKLKSEIEILNKNIGDIETIKLQEQILQKQIQKLIPRVSLRNFEIHLSEHCNLNCQCCNHYSPIAQKEFIDKEVFCSDMSRMYELTKGDVEFINLLGGEPLLNPDLLYYLKKTREIFKNTTINLMSNGILLNQQNEDFWKTCFENKIRIGLTKYPIKLDWKALNKNFEYYKVEKYIICEEIKNSWHFPLDLEGKQDARENFINCEDANNCIFLRNGKLYTCVVPPNVHHFNKFFNKNVPVCERDYIDIYKAHSIDEILQFLAKPIPFCRYCNVKARRYDLEWKTTNKDIKEWV